MGGFPEGTQVFFRSEAKNRTERKTVIAALRKFNPSDLLGRTLEFITNGEKVEGEIKGIQDGMLTHYTISVLIKTETPRVVTCNIGTNGRYNSSYTLTII